MAATARERSPASEEAFHAALTKGGELLAANRVDEARAQLEHANTLVPKNEKTLNLLGLTYFKLGQFAQAAQVYEVLASDNPVDPTLRVNLGLAYLKTNDLTRAVKEFETATDLEPEHKKAHNYLGLALAQVGDYERARHHFVQAGSEAMAEKMGKAIVSAQPPLSVPLPSGPTESSAVALPGNAPAPPPQPAPAPPALPEDDSIEVMSDDDATTPDTVEESELIEDSVVAAEPAPAAPPDVIAAAEEPGDVASHALATDEALRAVATESPVPAPPWIHASPSEEQAPPAGGYSSHDSVSDAAAAHAAEMGAPTTSTDEGGGLVAVEAPADYAATAPTWQQQPEGDAGAHAESSW
ncbi:MAG: tetratricopeptide repeat protein, partial [Archangium sp.]|nr:tetratricopeptide repeat protein [Archangium sp.]